ncbi:hypothetical protein E2C01_085632 [Portunus trituberculatus]|uniref:Uncharacterized protein n=1 Tax=Portunus trituberculatus TaxID=210409 RepID=A0A5B7J7D9_PORTR|nr:hypothetical protein [Portunus trituberculatus]
MGQTAGVKGMCVEHVRVRGRERGSMAEEHGRDVYGMEAEGNVGQEVGGDGAGGRKVSERQPFVSRKGRR